MAEIHPTAIIDSTAELAEDVKIGPYCVVGPHVKLGKGCVLHSHVVLEGPSTFGEGNEFFPFAVIGLKSQDLKYRGEPTFLEVGDYNVFRENCNINRSTSPETKTIIGSHNHFLINSHCGHECVVGNHCILSGYAGVAGHCHIGDWAIVSGFAALHQFVRVGEHSMVGGCARVSQDVPPFMIVEGSPAAVRAVNSIGMQRRGFSDEDVRAIKFAYRKLFLQKGCNVQEAVQTILQDEKYGKNARVEQLLRFLRESERGYTH
ncbi:MAG: acyl-ACP--UDP-N-acetylglucosamine O-acyltransferase [Akkermansiaceae bacterium]|nr:acyl-ACP--UDP-N-acetylglucosamine O-acyltransferase [Akkermansiaceae bacterium]